MPTVTGHACPRKSVGTRFYCIMPTMTIYVIMQEHEEQQRKCRLGD